MRALAVLAGLIAILAGVLPCDAQDDFGTSASPPPTKVMHFKAGEDGNNDECKVRYRRYPHSYLRYVERPHHTDFITSYRECFRKCCTSSSFRCKSFSYFWETQQCFLMNVTQHDDGVVLAYSKIHVHVELAGYNESEGYEEFSEASPAETTPQVMELLAYSTAKGESTTAREATSTIKIDTSDGDKQFDDNEGDSEPIVEGDTDDITSARTTITTDEARENGIASVDANGRESSIKQSATMLSYTTPATGKMSVTRNIIESTTSTDSPSSTTTAAKTKAETAKSSMTQPKEAPFIRTSTSSTNPGAGALLNEKKTVSNTEGTANLPTKSPLSTSQLISTKRTSANLQPTAATTRNILAEYTTKSLTTIRKASTRSARTSTTTTHKMATESTGAKQTLRVPTILSTATGLSTKRFTKTTIPSSMQESTNMKSSKSPIMQSTTPTTSPQHAPKKLSSTLSSTALRTKMLTTTTSPSAKQEVRTMTTTKPPIPATTELTTTFSTVIISTTTTTTTKYNPGAKTETQPPTTSANLQSQGNVSISSKLPAANAQPATNRIDGGRSLDKISSGRNTVDPGSTQQRQVPSTGAAKVKPGILDGPVDGEDSRGVTPSQGKIVICSRICMNGGVCQIRTIDRRGRRQEFCKCANGFEGDWCENVLTVAKGGVPWWGITLIVVAVIFLVCIFGLYFAMLVYRRRNLVGKYNVARERTLEARSMDTLDEFDKMGSYSTLGWYGRPRRNSWMSSGTFSTVASV